MIHKTMIHFTLTTINLILDLQLVYLMKT